MIFFKKMDTMHLQKVTIKIDDATNRSKNKLFDVQYCYPIFEDIFCVPLNSVASFFKTKFDLVLMHYL